MARIVITSAAFWGDVMPFVPIARELTGRGHDVVYALPPDHHSMLEGEPFGLVDNGSTFSPQDVLADPRQRDLIERRGMTMSGGLLARYWAKRYTVQELDQIVTATSAVLDGADLMITHPTMGSVSGIAADIVGVPWITGHLFPMMLPSAQRPPSTVAIPQLPGAAGHAVNRAAWAAGKVATGLMTYDRSVNRFRARHGLPPVRASMLMGGVSSLRTLVLVSPAYFPPPTDWPASTRMTGFTVWDGSTLMPPEVDAFLAAGDAPVVVTMGTCAAATAQRVFAVVAETLDELGLRGLYLVAHEENCAGALADRDGVFTFAPLGAVLPSCRAIVHAGSHGTNATAMHAGVPSVAVPVLFDQLWHGRRTEELGIGRLARRGARRPDEVRGAITDVVTDDRYTVRAGAFAARLAEEDGVGTACDEVEDVLAGL
jgi:UDP:flavonoid glycosyltransferase YjiC (YdhE family)